MPNPFGSRKKNGAVSTDSFFVKANPFKEGFQTHTTNPLFNNPAAEAYEKKERFDPQDAIGANALIKGSRSFVIGAAGSPAPRRSSNSSPGLDG